MKTVGEILQAARTKRGLTINQISQATKIQAKFLEALEKNAYELLPQSAFVKGFIRNYALAINIDPQGVLAIFRRDWGQDTQGKVIPRGLTSPSVPKLAWTPQTTLIATITTIVVIFAAYLFWQFRLLTNGPSLNVNKPPQSATVGALVEVAGTTHPQATLTINSQQISVNDKGEFNSTISLSPGEHTITITTTSRAGHSTTIQRTVTVN